MERCPRCKKMSAHRDHKSGHLICYRIDCEFSEAENNKKVKRTSKTKEKISCSKEGVLSRNGSDAFLELLLANISAPLTDEEIEKICNEVKKLGKEKEN